MQPNAITVQQEVNRCLSMILKTELNISGSGRTDTGVHCRQQFFHVDLDLKLSTDDLLFKLNSMLPYDISIKSIVPVTKEAHARYDATARSYEYHLNTKKNPFSKEMSYYFPKPLNIQNMNLAATLLCGEAQDYEAFSRIKTSVNNFICSISTAQWEVEGDNLIFHITSNRFLRGMVRAVVGTLMDVGQGRKSVDDIQTILESKDRKQAGRAAPAHGLYLTKVVYPNNVYIKSIK
jgi:tRNA pseudouridine38-40 synthase